MDWVLFKIFLLLIFNTIENDSFATKKCCNIINKFPKFPNITEKILKLFPNLNFNPKQINCSYYNLINSKQTFSSKDTEKLIYYTGKIYLS